VQAIDRLASRDAGAHGLWGLLEFENGTVGTIETVWNLPAGAEIATDDALNVIGTDGVARTQLDPAPLRIWTGEGSGFPDVTYGPEVHGAVTGALGTELAHFAQCALAGTPSPIVTPEDGALALAVVLALIEAAGTGEAITRVVRS
ncbi:MAG TPA: Gfo/Idh/MocA family oxidoreductase, partial [Thermomicrobiales bacterium]|nr:Gfo/Idh/MocA family oxidoreductase [Thermomicrobiales bacterium]